MCTSQVRNQTGLVELAKGMLRRGHLRTVPRPLSRAGGECGRAELLEPRTLLSSLPYISEFMANDDNTYPDEDGDYPGWIEIANPGVDRVDLGGYHLTDDKGDLDKWEFPAATIEGGGYLVVFLSKDTPGSGTKLHTNFQLADSGEYLALVGPDGATVLSEFAPKYPTQKKDISYGIATDVRSAGLLPSQAPLKVLVPTSDALGTTWWDVGFSDLSWRSGTGGVGFDLWTAPPAIPGFTVEMVDFNEGIGDIVTAQQILNGTLPAGFTVAGQATKNYAVVNHGPGGSFAPDELLPDGRSDTETYALRCTANVFIPTGTWTIDVGSDDGFMLTIPGVSFASNTRYNENYNNVGGGLSRTGWCTVLREVMATRRRRLRCRRGV